MKDKMNFNYNSVQREEKINWAKIIAIVFIILVIVGIIVLEDFLKSLF